MSYLPPEVAAPRREAVRRAVEATGLSQRDLAFHTGIPQTAWCRAFRADALSRAALRADMFGDEALAILAGLLDQHDTNHGDAIMALAGADR